MHAVAVGGEKKRTDVNVTAQLLDDACNDRLDMARIVSGDSDLVAFVESVRERLTNRRVIVATSPNAGQRISRIQRTPHSRSFAPRPLHPPPGPSHHSRGCHMVR